MRQQTVAQPESGIVRVARLYRPDRPVHGVPTRSANLSSFNVANEQSSRQIRNGMQFESCSLNVS